MDGLLDSMGQAVSTIKAATEALESATDFLEQAKAVATQTLEDTSGFLSDQPIAARVSNETELLDAINSGKQGLIVIEGSITLSENQVLNLQDGQSLVGANYLDPNKGGKDELIFNMTDTSNQFAVRMANDSSLSNLNITFFSSGRNSLFSVNSKQGVKFSNLNIDFTAQKNENVSRETMIFHFSNSEASFYDQINIKAKGEVTRGINIYNKSSVVINDESNFNIEIDGENIIDSINAIFVSSYCIFDIYSGAILNSEIKNSSTASNLLISKSILNVENAKINLLNQKTVNNNRGFIVGNGSIVNIKQNSVLNIKSSKAINIEATLESCSMNIIEDSEIHVELEGTNTNTIIIQKPASGINTVNFASGTKISVKDHNNPANDGYWKLDKDWEKEVDTNGSNETINDFNSIAEFVDTGETYQMFDDLPEINFDTVVWDRPEVYEDSLQYASIISQYDSLIKDASYKGVNLLQGQDLKVTFNEGRTAWLDVLGKDASSQSLGLVQTSWMTKKDVEKAIEELTNAVNQIRSMSSELGSYYNIVLSRQDFTENLINVLEEGADKLTLADMNEESANMLALQTRQQLAINSLSLASQAAQGILRLF